MKEELSRLGMLIGAPAIEKLRDCHVAVFGVGGVGGYVCEALARCGVGKITVFDNDVVSKSNINRQIIALHSTVGIRKTELIKKRMEDINPDIKVVANNVFYSEENADQYDLRSFDYIADAIDSVPSKTELIARAKETGVPIISSMGTGNKLDPLKLRVKNLSETAYCPLAKTMRQRLRKRGITDLTVVCSDELPIKPSRDDASDNEGKTVPGSSAFVPPVAGMIIASEIVKELIK